jgi:hypothetical protein
LAGPEIGSGRGMQGLSEQLALQPSSIAASCSRETGGDGGTEAPSAVRTEQSNATEQEQAFRNQARKEE